jgi:hypothetical protein
MIVHTTTASLTLEPGQSAWLQLRAGTRLRGLQGSAWLTADGDPTDVVLARDDEWVLAQDRRILAYGLHQGPAQIALDERAAAVPA